jgi:hypothetical protein
VRILISEVQKTLFFQQTLNWTVYTLPIILLMTIVDEIIFGIFWLLFWVWGIIANYLNYLCRKKIYRNENELIIEVWKFQFKYDIKDVRIFIKSNLSKFGLETFLICVKRIGKAYPKFLFGTIILNAFADKDQIMKSGQQLESYLGIDIFDLTN